MPLIVKACLCANSRRWRHQFELYTPWTVMASVWTIHAMDCEGISLNWTCRGLWRHQSELYMSWTVKASVWTGHAIDWRHQYELDIPQTVKASVWTIRAMDCDGISLKWTCHGLWRYQFKGMSLCAGSWTVEVSVWTRHAMDCEGVSLN